MQGGNPDPVPSGGTRPAEPSCRVPRWQAAALRLWWRFPGVLQRVAASGERELLVYRGWVVGAVVPLADLERLRQLDETASAARNGVEPA